MKRGISLFWLLVVVLFGGSVYFGAGVLQMKRAPEAQASGAAP